MIFHIALGDKSARFLNSGDLKTWTTDEDRGFTDDPADYAADKKMNAAAKCALLEVVLGSIAGSAPIIGHSFIVNQSTSLDSIWDRLRTRLGFRKTGGRVLEWCDMRREENESREALWERLYSFFENILLTKTGGVMHEGAKPTVNEKFSPTLQNIMVASWLNILNPALPAIVHQRFITQLRCSTVFSLREEISDAIPSLLLD